MPRVTLAPQHMSEATRPIVAPRLDLSASLQLLHVGTLGVVVLAAIRWPPLAQWNEAGAGDAVDLAPVQGLVRRVVGTDPDYTNAWIAPVGA